ncbi:efflux RND transporter periplasmic adaptor subunit [Marinobacter sp.]|uniref:efflux RND transporter periplasmic adaptor subunit n=1 Tax=Marinobacter sp. TaxID=50741 RepID=UPI00384CAF2A
MPTADRKSLLYPRSALIASLIFVAVVLWMFSGVLHDSEPPEIGEEVAAKQADEAVSVRVLESHHQVIQDRIIINGRTLADRSVTVKAETDGVVEQLYLEQGDRVDQGDLLVELAVESRQARVQEARSLVEQREIEFRAAQQLRERDSISETMLANAQALLESARAQFKMAVSEVERTQIRAPIEGLIETRYVEQGDFLSRGASVATVVDLSPIRVRGSLSERHLNRIDEGDSAEVRLINDSVHEGKVVFVGRVAEVATRTFPVEVVIDNEDGDIIEGLTAEVALFADELVAHRLPASILTLADDGTLGVKGVSGTGKVLFYPVEVVRDTPDGVWLTGLPESARVIAVGHEFVSAGQQVETVPFERLEIPGVRQ